MNYIKQKTKYRFIPLILIVPLILTVKACNEVSTSAKVDNSEMAHNITDSFANRLVSPDSGEKIMAELSKVRRLTAPYQNHEKGIKAGWFAPLSECVENPGVGGMGIHYGNPVYLEDGIVDLLKPEVLLYEPQENGRLRLVGIEYIVPGNILGPESLAPILLGEKFHWNPIQNIWALHVWIWRNNPSGMFADWNPKVNCDFAS